MRYRGRYREPKTSLHVLNLIILAFVLLGILVVGQRAAEFMSEAFVDITDLSEASEGEAPEDGGVVRDARVRVAYALNEARRIARDAGEELRPEEPTEVDEVRGEAGEHVQTEDPDVSDDDGAAPAAEEDTPEDGRDDGEPAP